MRVLLVANTLPPLDLSGAGEQVVQLAAGLRDAGHTVEILGRGPGGARGPKVLFPATIAWPTVRALRRFRPDVVQVHESDGALAALVVRLGRRWLRSRPLLVALLQVSYLEEIRAVRPLRYRDRVLGRPGAVEKRFRWLKGPVQLAFGMLTAKLADRVVACSRQTADEIERDYGVRDIEVLPNVTGGLDIEVAPARPDDPPEGYLLYVGRLRIRKGVEVLLEAFAALRQDQPKARLVVAGSGEQREALEHRASVLGLDDAVQFLGRCDASHVRRLLLGARALVVPSIYEGMPLVILEAMASEVPVIASSVSGIPEVVVDGETGWLVPREDPPVLHAALAEACASPAVAARRGRAGKVRLLAHFTPTHAAQRWEGLVSR